MPVSPCRLGCDRTASSYKTSARPNACKCRAFCCVKNKNHRLKRNKISENPKLAGPYPVLAIHERKNNACPGGICDLCSYNVYTSDGPVAEKTSQTEEVVATGASGGERDGGTFVLSRFLIFILFRFRFLLLRAASAELQ
jgi:hypothetical protein